MNGLKVSQTIFALYIKKDRFIGYFGTFSAASKFAEKFYKNVESHVEPYVIFDFEETTDERAP